MTTEDSNARFRELTGDLPFEPNSDTVERSVAEAELLLELARGLYSEHKLLHPDRVGRHRGDDQFNALLNVYDAPRRERTTGDLSNLSIAIKDNIAVKGLPMTCGCERLSHVSTSDATVVERLLDAGGRIVGTTNMDVFGFGPTGEYSDFGRVRNPLIDGVVPGGSSSGSAAAVAGGVVDASLGTDTGGSVRIPAACCGLVGVKPTHRVVPRDGFVDFAPSLDTIGPITRDVSTAAGMLDCISGYTPRDPSSSHTPLEALTELELPDDLSIGLPSGYLDASDRDVVEVVRNVADALESQHNVSVRDIEFELDTIDQVYLLVGATEFAWTIKQTGAIRGQGTGYSEEWRNSFSRIQAEDLGDHIARRVLPAAYVDALTTGRAYTAARARILDFQRAFGNLFDRVDAVLLPTLRRLPPRFDEIDSREAVLEMNGNSSTANLTGCPAVTLQGGSVDGLPVGVQVMTPQFEDRLALTVAHRIERIMI